MDLKKKKKACCEESDVSLCDDGENIKKTL